MPSPQPFVGPIPPTVALRPPPLPLVLAQVRFPLIASIGRDDDFAPFQERMRVTYPVAASEREVVLAPGRDGMEEHTTRLWRLRDAEDQWVVTLTPDFVALETSAYPGHREFFSRLRDVLAAVAATYAPARVDRLGVRYISRVDEPEALARLGELIRPEVLGLAGMAADAGTGLELVLTQAHGQTEGASVAARWGVLPAGVATDSSLPASSHTSWVLDVDVSRADAGAFDPEALAERAFQDSRLQYRFFRWVVTDAFLDYYKAGGAE